VKNLKSYVKRSFFTRYTSKPPSKLQIAEPVVERNSRFKIANGIALTIVIVCLAVVFPWSKVSPVPGLVGLLAFGAAVATPIILGRKSRGLMVAWFAAYVVTYSVLSWQGTYIDANLGGNDNRSIWYPAHCGEAYQSRAGRQKSTLKPLGWFFLPMVIADRWFVHRTQFDAF
jgi:hypothetical protein